LKTLPFHIDTHTKTPKRLFTQRWIPVDHADHPVHDLHTDKVPELNLGGKHPFSLLVYILVSNVFIPGDDTQGTRILRKTVDHSLEIINVVVVHRNRHE